MQFGTSILLTPIRPPYRNLNQIFEALAQVPYTLLTRAQRVAFSTILFKQVTYLKLGKMRNWFWTSSISCTFLRASIGDGLQREHLTLVLGVRYNKLCSAKFDDNAIFAAPRRRDQWFWVILQESCRARQRGMSLNCHNVACHPKCCDQGFCH